MQTSTLRVPNALSATQIHLSIIRPLYTRAWGPLTHHMQIMQLVKKFKLVQIHFTLDPQGFCKEAIYSNERVVLRLWCQRLGEQKFMWFHWTSQSRVMTRVLSTWLKTKSMHRLPVAIPTALALRITYEANPTLLSIFWVASKWRYKECSYFSTCLGVRNRPNVWIPFSIFFLKQ